MNFFSMCSEHHCNLYNLVDWTSLHTRRLHHWFLLIYKSILGITPLYLSSLLHLSLYFLNFQANYPLMHSFFKLASKNQETTAYHVGPPRRRPASLWLGRG